MRNIVCGALCGLLGLASFVEAQTSSGVPTFSGTAGANTSGGSPLGNRTGAGEGGGGGGAGNFGPTGGLSFGGGAMNTGPGGKTGTGVTFPSATNPFRSSYANALGVGIVGATANTPSPRAAFGQPLYGAITSTNAAQAAAAAAALSGFGFNTLGMRKATPYVTTLSDDFPRVQIQPAQLERNLQEVLQRSSSLSSRSNIVVTLEGPQVVLRGTASTPRERRLAESLLRLTPGVRDVRNEIVISSP